MLPILLAAAAPLDLEAPGVLLTAAAVADKDWTYPAYCAKVSEALVPLRSIPQLSAEARELELSQVLTIVRHGARTPADRYNCWANYDPQWDCGVDLAVQARVDTPIDTSVSESAGLLGGEAPSWSASALHPKHYDVNSELNVLGGTCQKGQLLTEGFQQHQLIGHNLARAYQVPNDPRRIPAQNAPPLVDLAKADQQIYFRSSDMQRTAASGSALLASFSSTATKGKVDSIPIVPLHTMDLSRETLFPNTGTCPALLNIRDAIFGSPGYLSLRSKWASVEERFRVATSRSDISDVWPGELFDCVLTAVCSGKHDRLPPGIRPTMTIVNESGDEMSLVDALVRTVDDYAQFEYKFKDATFSRSAIAYAMVDFKTEIIRTLMQNAQTKQANATETLSAVIGHNQALEFLDHMSGLPTRAINGTNFDPKKLVIFAGHDTTLMPFLASLGGTVYDNKWPPYASQVVLEVYHTVSKPAEAHFRLMYNGAVLTRDVPGCTQTATAGSTEICPISVFFEATDWATPANARKICEGSGVRATGAAEERWLLRKRISSSQPPISSVPA